MRDSIIFLSILLAAALAYGAQEPQSHETPPDAIETMDGGWPKDVQTSLATFTVYQPQIDAFDGHETRFYAALAHSAKEDDPPVFGVAWFDARTHIDKPERVVLFAAWGPSGWAATTGNVYHRWGSTTAVTRQSAGYNAWTGNAWRGGAGMSYNSRTGTVAAGQRSAVGNVYTGDYAYGGRGAATNARTGTTVAGGRVTAVNTRTGNEVTAGRAAAVNPRTGQAGSAGYVRGEQGSAVRVGDDVYVSRDGNVYKRNPSGGWDQHQGSGSWSGVQDRSRTQTLNAQQRARSYGSARSQSYGRARSMGMRGGGRSRR